MASLRTLCVVGAFVGAFTFLFSSLDRTNRPSDCAALGAQMSSGLEGVNQGLTKMRTNDLNGGRADLLEVASHIKQLNNQLDQLHLGHDEVRSIKTELAIQLSALTHGLEEMTRGMATEQQETVKKGRDEVLEASTHIPERLTALEHLCLE